jgi:hypothetical protein
MTPSQLSRSRFHHSVGRCAVKEYLTTERLKREVGRIEEQAPNQYVELWSQLFARIMGSCSARHTTPALRLN